MKRKRTRGSFDEHLTDVTNTDLDPAWKTMKKFKEPIVDFVAGGSRYLGFCLGAYLAGEDPGFELLPPGVDTDQEVTQDDAQVHDEKNTIIQVDWTFSTGDKKGKTEKNRWLYFQDGAAILGKVGKHGDEGKVLGRYSKSEDVAAYVAGYRKGVVGVVGPHPEATKDWCKYFVWGFLDGVLTEADDDEHIKNPTGYDLDVGRDFIRAVMEYK